MKNLIRSLLMAVALVTCAQQAAATQTTILAAGTSAADSAHVVSATSGTITAAGIVGGYNVDLTVYRMAGATPVPVGDITASKPTFDYKVGEFYVHRTDVSATPLSISIVSDLADSSGVASSVTCSTCAQAAAQTTAQTSLTGIASSTAASATAANQTAVRSSPGTSATTAVTVQGSATGVAIPVSLASLPALTAGSAKVGIFTTDETAHGTSDLVAADVTKVAGSAVNTGNGTAAGSERVAVPSDNTAVALWGHTTAGGSPPSGLQAISCRAATGSPTNSTGGTEASVMCNHEGALVTKPALRENTGWTMTTISSASETTVVAAGGAGVLVDITHIDCSTNGTTAGTLILKDATGGTSRATYYYPSSAAAPASPMVNNWSPAAPQAAANNNWTITASAGASDTYVCTVNWTITK